MLAEAVAPCSYQQWRTVASHRQTRSASSDHADAGQGVPFWLYHHLSEAVARSSVAAAIRRNPKSKKRLISVRGLVQRGLSMQHGL